MQNARLFFQSKDLELPEYLKLDGVIHRFSSQQTQDNAEWYIGSIIKNEGFYLTVGSWRTGNKYTYKSFEGDIPKEHFENSEKVIQEEETKKRKESVAKATSYWLSCEPCASHPYLEKKNLPPFDLKVFHQYLLIPIFDINHKLISLQSVSPEGQKKIFSGTSPKGGFYTFGDFEKSKEYYVCEGWATAASVHLATKRPAVVSFGASNIAYVGKVLKDRYPSKKGVLAADNDEAGRKAAQDWRKLVNSDVRFPENEGEDYNDMALRLDDEAITQSLKPSFHQRFNIKELCSLDIPELGWINSVLTEKSFNILYGEGGCGKSRIAYEWAFNMACGKEFLAWKNQRTVKTLIVDGEMTMQEIIGRINSIIGRHLDTEIEEENFGIVASDSLDSEIDLYNEESRKKIDDSIEKADVIFLDNLNNLTNNPKGDSMNSHYHAWDEMRAWMKRWQSKGKTFFLLCHKNKGSALQGIVRLQTDAQLILEITKPFDSDKQNDLDIYINFSKARHIPERFQEKLRVTLSEANQKMNHGWKFS